MLEGPEHRIVLANPSYLNLIGHRDIIGKTIAEALPDAVEQGYLNLLDDVTKGGEAFASRGARYEAQVISGGPTVEHFVDFVFQPITDADGSVTGIFVEGSDVTERVRAEKQRAELTRELSHRMKNTLAMVQAIVSQKPASRDVDRGRGESSPPIESRRSGARRTC